MKKIFLVFIAVLVVSTYAQKIIEVNSGTSISKALIGAKRGDTILVAPGIYKEKFIIPSGVTLVSKKDFKAIIDGQGRGTIITLSNKSAIIGFDIKNGTYGVMSKGPAASIINCRIYRNSGTAILSTGNLPYIYNNLLVFNGGSGVQGIDISSGSNVIERNTIAYNLNSGITIDGKLSLLIKNNVISHNTLSAIRLSELAEKIIKISHNIIYKNYKSRIFIPKSNLHIDPKFKDPKKKSMDFSLKNPAVLSAADDGSAPGVNY